MDVKPVNGKASQANLTHAASLAFGLKHILDYGDLIVAPGLIDTHVHMDQPGRTNWEGRQLLHLQGPLLPPAHRDSRRGKAAPITACLMCLL